MEKYKGTRHTIYMKPGLWKRLRLYAFNGDTSVSKMLTDYAEKLLGRQEKNNG